MPVDGASMFGADSKNTGVDRNSRIFTNSMIFLILIFGCVISFLFYQKLALYENREASDRLKSHIEDHIDALGKKIDVLSEALESIRGLYEASEFVSRDEFSIFTTQILKRHHEIITCEWLPLVPEDDLRKFEQAVRRDGIRDFQITQVNDKDELVKAEKRKFYFPILYVEPLQSHRRIIGFDIASNPEWKKLLDQSAAEDRMLATDPVNLIQSNHHKVIVLALPVFKDKLNVFGKQKNTSWGSSPRLLM